MACSCMCVSSEGAGLHTGTVKWVCHYIMEINQLKKSHGQASQAIFYHRNKKVTTETKKPAESEV